MTHLFCAHHSPNAKPHRGSTPTKKNHSYITELPSFIVHYFSPRVLRQRSPQARHELVPEKPTISVCFPVKTSCSCDFHRTLSPFNRPPLQSQFLFLCLFPPHSGSIISYVWNWAAPRLERHLLKSTKWNGTAHPRQKGGKGSQGPRHLSVTER